MPWVSHGRGRAFRELRLVLDWIVGHLYRVRPFVRCGGKQMNETRPRPPRDRKGHKYRGGRRGRGVHIVTLEDRRADRFL